jgi:hypothetical protein
VRCANRCGFISILAGCLSPFVASAQIDPIPRDMIQVGYNASFEGHAPLAIYAYYLHNQPHFIQTNLALRLAIAPTYVDSELGIRHALGAHTDLGIGLAGGGFADSYDEIRDGTFKTGESFVGHGVGTSLGVYHRFNPDQRIPLNGVLRGIVHYSTYEPDDSTSPDFVLPADHTTYSLRAGLRLGGREPILYPSLALELSAWYEVQFRSESGPYGLTNSSGTLDRDLNPVSQRFWAQALLAYTFTNSGQSFYVSLIGGSTVEADRFSAYRLGAFLPLVSEFPLLLPGYYYQEISAQKFALLGGNYFVPLDQKRRWNLNVTATTAVVDYLPGLEQPGNWHTGVGAGLLYQTPSLKLMVGYAYGVNAIRSHGRGANSVGILLQIDLKHAKEAMLNPEEGPGLWRGFQRVFSGFGQ